VKLAVTFHDWREMMPISTLSTRRDRPCSFGGMFGDDLQSTILERRE
jgi:hypothetical protein